MSEDIVIQLIISFSAIVVQIVAVIIILARRLSTVTQSNGQVKIDDSFQKQINGGVDGTKTLSSRFDDQVNICNQRWLEAAKFDGRIDAYMIEIRDRLARMEAVKDV